MECCFVRVFFFLAFVLALNIIFCSPVCQHHGSHFGKHSHDPKDTSHNTSHEHRISRRNMNSFSIENSISINRNDLLYGNENDSNINQREYFGRNEGIIRVIDDDENDENCTDCHINTKHFGCMCALFTTQSPGTDDVPLVSKTFQNVSCHEHVPGEEACTEVCISFAMSYYEVRDIMLCTHAYNATNLTGYLQTKVCVDDGKWVFTGLSNSTPLCCNMGQVVECNNEVTSTSRK